MTTHTVPVQTRDNTEKNDNTEFKLILDLHSNCGSARLAADTASVTICDTRSENALSQSMLQYPYLCVSQHATLVLSSSV